MLSTINLKQAILELKYPHNFNRVWVRQVWKGFLAQTILAEFQLTGIEPATLVTGPSNSTTELRP